MHFVCEVGSCHMNKKEYIQEFIEKALEAGADSVKFQLFPNKPHWIGSGNVYLERKNFEYAMSLAPNQVSASVFDEDSLHYLISLKPKFIKFAYSQHHQKEWMIQCKQANIPIIVTASVWDNYEFDHVKLTTALESVFEGTTGQRTLYPNPYMMDFSGLFPEYFQGYSDHSIGWHNAHQAKLAGAQVIEKHLKLDKPDILCPDAVFASSDFSKIRHFK